MLLLAATPSFALDEVVMLPIVNALNLPEAQQRLGNSVKFYFGDQQAGRVAQTFGRFVANPKSNGFGKTEGSACERAFLSALLSFQERAESVGGNAVINIESYYKKHEVSSATEFECHKGVFVTGVALRGVVVRLAGH
jgi:uncharacterized protein YbjQ (UPF0145 family)